MTTYLIIGGTGKVGSRLAQALRSAGATARIASRKNGDIRFDWHDQGTFAPALDGVDGVFIVGPGSATDWSPILTELLETAEKAGVRQAVLLSARGVEFLPDGAVARSERALRASALEWTILRPSHFSQNFTEAMFVPVNGQIVAPVAEGAEPFIDAGDIAEAAGRVLVGGEFARQVIELSGPTALTFVEAASVLESASGESTRFVDEPLDVHADGLRAAGTPEGYITWRMAMLEGIRSGQDAYLSSGVQDVLGRPATSFAEWAAREVGVAA